MSEPTRKGREAGIVSPWQLLSQRYGCNTMRRPGLKHAVNVLALDHVLRLGAERSAQTSPECRQEGVYLLLKIEPP